jgi:hypothetical protein
MRTAKTLGFAGSVPECFLESWNCSAYNSAVGIMDSRSCPVYFLNTDLK